LDYRRPAHSDTGSTSPAQHPAQTGAKTAPLPYKRFVYFDLTSRESVYSSCLSNLFYIKNALYKEQPKVNEINKNTGNRGRNSFNESHFDRLI